MKFLMKSRWIGVLLATTLSAGLSSVSANDDFFGTGFNKQLLLRLSGFQASTSTDVRVDSQDGVRGAEISFEDDLGLSD